MPRAYSNLARACHFIYFATGLIEWKAGRHVRHAFASWVWRNAIIYCGLFSEKFQKASVM